MQTGFHSLSVCLSVCVCVRVKAKLYRVEQHVVCNNVFVCEAQQVVYLGCGVVHRPVLHSM
jgi:hypothetical protein